MPKFDLSDPVVNELSFGTTVSSTGAVDAPESLAWDCSIGDLNFLYGISDTYPFKRETSEFRRQRVDTSTNPGEQSLDSGYWLRSHSSWHYGSGLTTAEPMEVADSESQFRYKEGGGIDPWTAGQVTLLNSTASVLASAGSNQQLIGVDTGVLHADGTVLNYITNAGVVTAVTWGGAGSITSLTTDGGNYYAADTTGIYRGALPSGAGTLIWNTGSTPVIRWVKSRLMATVGRGVYELVGAGPALPTALDTGTSRPTNWTWTDISEGPAAIYLSGYVGDSSVVEKITITSSASAVTLSKPTVVSDMPRGEIAQTLYSYVGSYLIVGTSKGVRFATMATDGSLTLGPLVVQSAGGVADIVASGSFAYVTVGAYGNAGDRTTRAGLYRIDLGQNLSNNALDFAHAADLVAPSGTSGAATQVTLAGGSLYFSVNGTGVFKQQATYVASGWLETGRIRLGTIEGKAWRDVRLLVQKDVGGVATVYGNLEGVTSPSNWDVVITGEGTRPDVTGKLTAVSPSPSANLYVAVQLESATSNTVTPILLGYQVRAVVAPNRTRLLSVPVLCFDNEIDRKGARYGKPGLAWSKLSQLQDLEQNSAVVQWRDHTTGEAATAYIERVSFTRTNPPTRQVSGNGGVATVLLRLV